jgi:hypothetical protein
MKILSIEHDPKRLLLVDGKKVINGSYDLIHHKDGSFGNHVNNIKAYFVMEALPSWTKGKWDYNSALDKAEKHIESHKLKV